MSNSSITRPDIGWGILAGSTLGFMQAVAFVPAMMIVMGPVGRFWPSEARPEEMAPGLAIVVVMIVFALGGMAWRIHDELAPGSRYRWITRGVVLVALARTLAWIVDDRWPTLPPVLVASMIGAVAIVSVGRWLLGSWLRSLLEWLWNAGRDCP